MVSREVIVERIARALPGARIELEDTTGTEDHYEAVVVAAQFEGKSRLEQHKMVYAALGDLMGGGPSRASAIHALALKTWTPADFDARTAR